jgi:hypothetical protein
MIFPGTGWGYYNGCMTEFKPLKFISEAVEVQFSQPPVLEKMPGCPESFTWRGERYKILELLNEWHDYDRKGRMARNMQPQHAAHARQRGSWGVGQDCFRVRTAEGRIFDLYYDRAPQDAFRRKGGWFLDREMTEQP